MSYQDTFRDFTKKAELPIVEETAEELGCGGCVIALLLGSLTCLTLAVVFGACIGACRYMSGF